MAQLDLGAEPDVAGEQAEQRRLRQRLQAANELPDARTGGGPALVENVVEPEDVAVEEALEVLRRRRDLVEAEELAHEAQVGASGELQALEPVRGVELGGEDLGKSLHARAARADKRAVNVK